MPLFEVAIIELPTKKEREEGKEEKLVFGPKAIIAKDNQAAGIAAVIDDPGSLKDVKRTQMQVLVRPFA